MVVEILAFSGQFQDILKDYFIFYFFANCDLTYSTSKLTLLVSNSENMQYIILVHVCR